MLNRYIELLVARPKSLLAIALLIVGALAAGAASLEIDQTPEAFLLPGDEDRVFLDRMHERFGSDEIIVIALITDDLFTTASLSKLQAMTQALEGIAAVEEVKSLATARHVENAGDDILVGPVYEEVPTTPAGLEAVRRRTNTNAGFVRDLISEDGRAAGLIVFFRSEVNEDPAAQLAATKQVVAKARAMAAPQTVHISGVPLFKVANVELSERDLSVFIPLLIFVSGLFLLIILRSARGLLLPVFAIALAVAATLGVIGHAGVPLNPFTNLVPAFVIMLAAAYSAHLMTAYAHALRDADRPEDAVQHVLQHVLRPMVTIVVTTFVGFGSMIMNPIPAARQLGVFTAVGVAILLPICTVVLPAILVLLGHPSRLPPRADHARSKRVWHSLAALAIKRPNLIFAAWTAATVIAIVGALDLQISSNALDFLRPDHDVRVAERTLEETLGGTEIINFFVDTGEEDGGLQPDVLRRLDALDRFARAQPSVDRTISALDTFDQVKRAFDDTAGSSTSTRALPATFEEASQYMLIYGYPEDFDRVLSDDHSTLRLALRTRSRGSQNANVLAAELEAEAERLGFTDGTYRAMSSNLLYYNAFDTIATSMVKSLAVSFAFVFLAMLVQLRSLRLSLLTMVPNVLPPLFLLGFMGLAQYKLDFANCSFAAIILGIAVDDTVHFLARFREERERADVAEIGLSRAMERAGPAMVFSTGVLAASLLTFGAAESLAIVNLGQLAAFGFLVCLVADLTLLPALLHKFS